MNAYDRLADGIVKGRGLDGKPVSKVSADAIRDELKSRGLLERDEKTGSFTRAARTMLYKAKSALVSANAPLAEKDGLIWRK